MSSISAGVRFIAGIFGIGIASVIPEKEIEAVNLYPHVNEATPEVRKCIDDFYHQYSISVPSDWIVLQKAKADFKAAMLFETPLLNTWIGLADYLNARAGVDLTKGELPKYHAAALVMNYILNEWMPKYGYDRDTCYEKYIHCVGDYIGFSCYRLPIYPLRNQYGVAIQYFVNDIGHLNPPKSSEANVFELLNLGLDKMTEQQRVEENNRASQICDILVEGYGRTQRGLRNKEIRTHSIKVFSIWGLILLAGSIIQAIFYG